MKDRYKIIAMTTLCADVFDATGEICPGGEALNFAMHACKYDYVDIAVIGAVGDDAAGDKIRSAMKSKPIDTSHVYVVEGAATATNQIFTSSEGDRYFKENSWNGGIYETYQLSAEDKRVIADADVVFINYHSPSFPDVIELKKSSSFRLAVDFNVERDFSEIEPYFPYVDFFLISGKKELLPVFEEFSKSCDCIFNVTLGDKGSVTYHAGTEYRVEAVPVERVVDTTGCGDSYHAGFVCSLVRNKDIIRAMKEGSQIAADNLQHFGGF